MASGNQSKNTSLTDMWDGVQNAASKNPATEKLLGAAQNFVGAKAQKAMTSVGEKAGGITQKLTDFSEGNSEGMGGLLGKGAANVAEGDDPGKAMIKAGGEQIKDKVKNVFSRGKSSGNPKVINIIEDINVGVSRRVAYDQWTQWQEFSKFMKGIESVEATEETKSNWRAKIWWSKRSWTATITEAIPDKRIAWTSEGAKGSTKGVITFHRLDDDLTKVLLVLEYYPQGFFEKTGNIWRAVGRRARLDLKHYRRFVMSQGEATDSWRAEVQDGEIVRTHDEVVEEEERQQEEQDQRDENQSDEYEGAEDELEDDEPEDVEDEYDDESEDDEPEDVEDEYDDESEDDEPEDVEDEYDDQADDDESDDVEDEYEEPEDEQQDEPADEPEARTPRPRRSRRKREPVNA